MMTTDRSKVVLLLWIFLCFFFFYLVFAMPLYASVNRALWSPAGKGLTSWLSFVVSHCELVTFPLVSRSGVVLDYELMKQKR